MTPKQYHAYALNQLSNASGVDNSVRGRDIKKVAVIGAGLMGAGIASCFLGGGIPTVLIDRDEDALVKGCEAVRETFKAAVKRKMMTPDQASGVMILLETTLDYGALADCDLVIEAAFEQMDVKEEIFKRLGDTAKQGAVLASNTSGLDIDRIAAASGRPADVVGLHFFSPAPVMPLLEIVRGKETSPDVIKTALYAALRIRKVGVVVGNCFGFAANRSMEGYGREAEFLILQGVDAEAIDRAVTNFGFPMGPSVMGDMAGIDVRSHVLDAMRADGHVPDDPRYGAVTRALVKAARFGQKTGAGFYDYGDDRRTPIPSSKVRSMIREVSAELGVPQLNTDEEEIVQRCLLPVINEAAKILDEGIVSKTTDFDLLWIYGYGFPIAKGGPVYYANQLGYDRVKAKLEEYAAADKAFGERYWAPSPALHRLFN